MSIILRDLLPKPKKIAEAIDYELLIKQIRLALKTVDKNDSSMYNVYILHPNKTRGNELALKEMVSIIESIELNGKQLYSTHVATTQKTYDSSLVKARTLKEFSLLEFIVNSDVCVVNFDSNNIDIIFALGKLFSLYNQLTTKSIVNLPPVLVYSDSSRPSEFILDRFQDSQFYWVGDNLINYLETREWEELQIL